MHISTPVPPRYLTIGPMYGEELQREISREQAAIALRSTAAYAVTILLAAGATGVFCWSLWTQLEKYELALKHCAGV